MTELYHYGVPGMKWGVRRYRNADGSLTPAGKKRVSNLYKKESIKVTDELARKNTHLYVTAHNKAAEKMNSGEIDRFNKEQEKKYGKDFAKRDGYITDYENMFDKEFAKCWNKTLSEFYDSNKHYKKAQELVREYDMTSWDDLAKNNAEIIKGLKEAIENN